MNLRIPTFIKRYLDPSRRCQKSIVRACKIHAKGGGSWQAIAQLYHYWNRRRYNIEIWPSVKLEGKIYIPHNIGIAIGKTAILGNNCMICPNVMVVAKWSPFIMEYDKEKGMRRHAKIGNDCILGAGALIVGPINIGNNVIIGAGAIVTMDIPNNSIVTGTNVIKRKDPELTQIFNISWNS